MNFGQSRCTDFVLRNYTPADHRIRRRREGVPDNQAVHRYASSVTSKYLLLGLSNCSFTVCVHSDSIVRNPKGELPMTVRIYGLEEVIDGLNIDMVVEAGVEVGWGNPFDRCKCLAECGAERL